MLPPEQIELRDLTTMRVGGVARTLVAPATRDELIETCLDVWGSGEDWFLLGGGSNLVVADDGFDGTVIRVVTTGIERIESDGDIRLQVQAGENWDELVAKTVSWGWSGIEALSGIPGSTGAAPVQNIGAYGQELSDSLVAVEWLDYLSGDVDWIPASQFGLGYRTSIVKEGRQGVVLAIELALRESATSVVAYDQLASALGVSVGAEVPIGDVRASVLRLRASKGMVLAASDPDSVSCGSFFTNPLVGENFARTLPAETPQWPVEPEPADVVVPLGEEPAPPPQRSDHRVKLSAAWLIERAGISKGFALPGSHAAISSKHTLAITNRGGATAAEVAELARFVQTRVFSEFGVRLQPEPNLVGVSL
jgi:UDP-N-acetylmuramate dehydrogenase